MPPESISATDGRPGQGGRLESRPLCSEPQASEGGPLHEQRGTVPFEVATGTPQAWWLRAPELFERIRRPRPRATWRGSYHLGDAILEIDSDDRSVAESLRELFGECAVADAQRGGNPRVRCTLRSQPDTEIVAIDLEANVPIDGVEIVCSLLEPRLGKYCTVRLSPLEGWSLVARKDSAEPLAAIAPQRALLRTNALRPNFFRDYAASAALRSQTGVLFLHGASVCVSGAGVLLAGRAGSGKTTLALTLASRGHGLLGDDLAALRQESLELLSLRRTLHIRRGPRGALVEQALRDRRVAMAAYPDSTPRAVVEARDLFPADPVSPSPLRAAFFLRAFCKRPSVESFVPSLAQMEPLRQLPVRLQWGITPARRLLRFAQAARCLARVPCYFLDVGLPEETADLIEKTVEEL